LNLWSLSHALPLQEISSKSVHNFFSYLTDGQTDRLTNRQTDRQTDRSKNITSFGGGNEAEDPTISPDEKENKVDMFYVRKMTK